MNLVHEFTWRVKASQPKPVGQVPWGTRVFHDLPSVAIEGDRLSGRSLMNGSDWILASEDGWARIDVRVPIETTDGALIYVRYEGWIEPTKTLMAAIEGLKPTEFEDQSIRTFWRLESGDDRYAWVNRSIFVGEGRLLPGGSDLLGMEHKVYRVG